MSSKSFAIFREFTFMLQVDVSKFTKMVLERTIVKLCSEAKVGTPIIVSESSRFLAVLVEVFGVSQA